MEHLNELDILFGAETDAKNELDKLKEKLDEDNKPTVLKEPVGSDEKIEEITPVSETEQITKNQIEDTVSSHNSSRLTEEKPIAGNNAESFNEHEKIDGMISSHNFVE